MKNVLVLVFLFVFILGMVTLQADIRVNWRGHIGFYQFDPGGSIDDSGDYILHATNSVSGVTLAQLIWSPDSTFATATTSAATGYLGAGNEIVLDTYDGSQSWTRPYGDYQPGLAIYSNSVFGQTLENGYIIARIFSDESPDLGDHFFDGIVSNAAGFAYSGGISPPVTYFHNTPTGISTFLGDRLNGTVIPEPTSLVFAFLGSLTILIKRVRKRLKD